MIGRYGRASVVLLGILVAVVTWNALRYPPGLGYDANDHFQYVLSLVERGEIPDGIGEYYTPPLFYAIAGAGWKIGTWIGLGEPLRVVQLLNAAFVVGSALLVLELARAILPGRRRAHALALGFVVAGAVAVKAGAMVHPEALSLLLCAAALALTARVIVDRAFGLAPAIAIGVLLGLAQLVRAFALWTVAVVLLTLVGVAIGLRAHRRQVLGTLAGTAVVAVLVASPWYAYQSSRYTNPIFDRPQQQKPLWERRPAAFYVDLGFPELITRPYRPSFRNRFWPTMYAESWGDYFGVFAWNASHGPPSDRERRELSVQMIAAIVPTALAVGGWLWLLATSVVPSGLRRAPERLLIGLLPLAGLVGMLYFTVSYPTVDGDVIKGSYMLTTLPAWAVAFAFATDAGLGRLGRRARLVAIAGLIMLAAIGVRFAIFGSPLGGIL